MDDLFNDEVFTRRMVNFLMQYSTNELQMVYARPLSSRMQRLCIQIPALMVNPTRAGWENFLTQFKTAYQQDMIYIWTKFNEVIEDADEQTEALVVKAYQTVEPLLADYIQNPEENSQTWLIRVIKTAMNEPMLEERRETKPTLLSNFGVFSKTSNVGLHDAAKEGDIDKLTLLLEKYPNCIDTIDPNGWTALHWAVHCEQLDCVKLLLEKGARYNITDTDNNTAVYFSVLQKKTEVVDCFSRMICKNYNGDMNLALRDAADKGDLSVVQLLYAAGADINAIGPKSGQSALHRAVIHTHKPVVDFLVQAGGLFGVKDKKNKQPFDYGDQLNVTW